MLSCSIVSSGKYWTCLQLQTDRCSHSRNEHTFTCSWRSLVWLKRFQCDWFCFIRNLFFLYWLMLSCAKCFKCQMLDVFSVSDWQKFSQYYCRNEHMFIIYLFLKKFGLPQTFSTWLILLYQELFCILSRVFSWSYILNKICTKCGSMWSLVL